MLDTLIRPVLFQPYIWIVRDANATSDPSIIQPQQGWLRTGGMRSLALRTRVLYSSGTFTLFLESCDTEDGYFEPLDRGINPTASSTPSDAYYGRDRPKSDYQRVREIVRWRVGEITGAIELCMQMRVTLYA